MRIAIVTQGYLAGGGVPTIAQWLRDELTERGCEVHVHDLAASSRDVRSRRVLSPATWRTHVVLEADPTDPELFHWGANWVELESQRYRPRHALTVALNTYDVIQVVAGGPALALAVSRARPAKMLQVATTLLAERRAHLPELPLPERVVKSLRMRSLHGLEVQALSGVDHVQVENRWMENWVREHGQANVTFAPPGIDVDTFHPVGDWDPSRPIIAFGRLGDSRKDWPTAVTAYERFVELTGLENELILAGKGPLSPQLRRCLHASPVRGRIRVHEDIPRAHVPGLLAGGSVFVQSSLEEGLGLAGLEAMACGLPVVATRTVGTGEYVRDGQNGQSVEIGVSAADGLAKGLAGILAGGVGGAMSAEARRTCREGYASSVAFERFAALYGSVTR